LAFLRGLKSASSDIEDAEGEDEEREDEEEDGHDGRDDAARMAFSSLQTRLVMIKVFAVTDLH
jgi:hypothetical protein